jgi:hypothetical protein
MLPSSFLHIGLFDLIGEPIPSVLLDKLKNRSGQSLPDDNGRDIENDLQNSLKVLRRRLHHYIPLVEQDFDSVAKDLAFERFENKVVRL